jgi:heme-degrading monooxygenase HmoA
MLCALTVRKLKPGTMEDFKRAFMPDDDDMSNVPAGWKEFYALRSVSDENEVITFGLFDGTLEELRAGQESGEYDQRRASVDEFVESVGADGIYEVVENRSMS